MLPKIAERPPDPLASISEGGAISRARCRLRECCRRVRVQGLQVRALIWGWRPAKARSAKHFYGSCSSL
jgi:hypothetical protein